MTDERDAVLVAGVDPDQVERLAARLRERWPVRTAYGSTDVLGVADDSVAVAVVDDRLDGVDDLVLPALREECSGCRVVVIADGAAATASTDRQLPRPVDLAAVVDAVEELLLRARYEELVDEYYARAAERATMEQRPDVEEGRTQELQRHLDRLESEVDDVLVALADHDAFARLCGEFSPDREPGVEGPSPDP